MWRIAREEEQRRRIAQARRRNQEERESARMARLEAEWKQFGAQVSMARRQQMNAAFWQHYEETFSEIKNYFCPPPPPAPEPEAEIVYLSEDEQGSARLGYSDFNPRLMARPQRWW